MSANRNASNGSPTLSAYQKNTEFYSTFLVLACFHFCHSMNEVILYAKVYRSLPFTIYKIYAVYTRIIGNTEKWTNVNKLLHFP